VKYSIEDDVLVLELSGPLPPVEVVLSALRAAAELVGDCGPLPVLLDVRRVRGSPSRDDMDRVETFLERQSQAFGTERAVVVESLLQYGLARVAAVVAEMRGARLRVFRDREKALAHLRWRAESAANEKARTR
jgi:hypothetical protein